jgi:hypothetical protein
MEHVCNSRKVNMRHHVGPNCWILLLPREHHRECNLHLDLLQNLVPSQAVSEVGGLIFQKDDAPTHFGAIVPSPLDDESAGEGRSVGSHGVLT